MPIFFAVVVIIIQGLLALVHYAVYRGVVAIFSLTNSHWLLALRIIFSLLAVSFVGASLLAFKWYVGPVRWLYVAAAIWVGLLLYLLLAVCVYGLAAASAGHLLPTVSLAWIGKLALACALVVALYGVSHAQNMQVKELAVQLPNLPASWQGRRAVWISDIHLGHVHGLKYLNRLIDKVEELKPDIIFVGGDLYDGTPFPVQESIASLRRLAAPLGTYFITGNHEEFGDPASYLEAVQAAGFTLLRNTKIELSGVQLIGVDYQAATKRTNFISLLQQIGVDNSRPSILLKHAPTDVDIAAQAGVSLQLSGHTHRAQLWPLSYITHLVYRGFDFGLKYSGAMPVYTSSGVGTWGPPLKVGNPSEIVLIKFN